MFIIFIQWENRAVFVSITINQILMPVENRLLRVKGRRKPRYSVVKDWTGDHSCPRVSSLFQIPLIRDGTFFWFSKPVSPGNDTKSSEWTLIHSLTSPNNCSAAAIVDPSHKIEAEYFMIITRCDSVWAFPNRRLYSQTLSWRR